MTIQHAHTARDVIRACARLQEGYGIRLSHPNAWVGRFGQVAWECDALRFPTIAEARAELEARGYRNSTNAERRNAYIAYLHGDPVHAH